MTDEPYRYVSEYLEYRDGKVYWKTHRGARQVAGKEAGGITNGYRRIKIRGKSILTHHIVWFLHTGEIPELLDHINGNPLDNRFENLRKATKSQNTMNSKLREDSTTGVKGLTKRHNNKYQARISYGGKRISLGIFEDKELAELVLIEARDKFHGTFARFE